MLLVLPALSPLFQPTLTRSADGLLHLYRLVALDHLIRQGVFFARWLPDLAYGYGLPLFVFYAPLSYYLTEILHLLGLNAVVAMNASTALAMLTAATGVYLFVKNLFGPTAGMLAGVAYVYAPYLLFNAFWCGSLPVIWAAALFPLTFWAFGRLLCQPSMGNVALSALTLAGALLMHNISSLLFLPLLLFYLALELTFQLIGRAHDGSGQWSALGGHGYGPDKKTRQLLSKHCTKGRKVALFVTHAAPETDPENMEVMEKFKKEAAAANLVGFFDCQGQLSAGTKFIMHFMSKKVREDAKRDSSKGQPDESRIAKARAFAKETMSRLG